MECYTIIQSLVNASVQIKSINHVMEQITKYFVQKLNIDQPSTDLKSHVITLRLADVVRHSFKMQSTVVDDELKLRIIFALQHEIEFEDVANFIIKLNRVDLLFRYFMRPDLKY